MPWNIKTFEQDENGAVTVDWVVLTAAIVGLGIATYTVVSGGVADASSDVSTQMTNQEIVTSFGNAPASINLAEFSLLGPAHSEAWRTDQVAYYEGVDNDALLAAYANSYPTAMRTGPHGGVESNVLHETDRIGVIEAEMASRGLARPEDNVSFTDLHATNS